MKTAEALSLAQTAYPDVVSVISQSPIARLWAGMGSIVRLQCQTVNGYSRTIIAKHIQCVNPKSFGDKRKAASYCVEAKFYSSHYNQELSTVGICCRGLHTEDNEKGEIAILMDPLPNPTIRNWSTDIARAAARSIAKFHALFWGNDKAIAAVDAGLAEQGTYWYLDTLPEEFDNMSNCGLSGKLKKAAFAIDMALKMHKYQTICHGDLKACNMSLSTSPLNVTFVDFQYIGKACPAKDLAYLFCCGMDVDHDFEVRQERELLELYIEELSANIINNNGNILSLPDIEDLTEALDLAYCDLYRWMLGWGIWGNGFLKGRVDRVLDGIIEKYYDQL